MMTRIEAQSLTNPPNTRPAPGPLDEPTRRSFELCAQITRTHARNFYYGLKLTPGVKRQVLYAIYAFMRACDDLVDQPIDPAIQLPSTQVLAQRIDQFRADMQQVIDTGELPVSHNGQENSIWPAFAYVMRTGTLDSIWLHAMLDGQQRDLLDEPFETFNQLYDYCFKVAGVVGLSCIGAWGYTGGEETRKMAEYRGIAFQLTNILRDLQEDYQRGRVYLPARELKQFGVDPAIFGQSTPNAAFLKLMRFQIQRAIHYYDLAQGLDERIEPDCQATSWAMTRIYRGLLDKIAADPAAVLRKRVRLSRLTKTRIALCARFHKPVSASRGSHA